MISTIVFNRRSIRKRGRTSLVDNLLNAIASPFTDQITTVRLPEKFQVPSIATFTEIEDLAKHLDNYRAHLNLHGTPKELACRAFPFTLFKNARDWFKKLPPKSIDSFDALGRKFLIQFLTGRIRNKPYSHLLTLGQHDNESLKDFIMRFNQVKLSMDDHR